VRPPDRGRRRIEGVLATGSTLGCLETPGPPPTSDVSSQEHLGKNQPIVRTGHLARHTTYWAIPDWWGRAQGLASSRDVVSARKLYLKYPTWAVTLS